MAGSRPLSFRPLSTLPVVVIAATLACLYGCGDDAGDAMAEVDAGPSSAAGHGSAGQAGAGEPDAGDPTEPTADCETDEIPGFGEVAIFDKCTMCHASSATGDERQGAPRGVNFDDYEASVAAAERAAQYVFLEVMPPSNAGLTVTEAEREQLYLWALCGTPR